MSFVHDDEYVITLDYGRKLTPSSARQLLDIGVRTTCALGMWAEMEPRPGEYDFSKMAGYVEKITATGMKIILTVYQGCPFWSPLNWFMKSATGEYSLFFHANPIYRRTDFDPSDYAHVSIFYPRQFPSFFCDEAYEQLYGCLREFRKRAPTDKLFMLSSTGIGGEYYGIGEYYHDDAAMADFRAYIALKYGDIHVYNSLHKKAYDSFEEVKYDKTFCNMDIVEWLDRAMISRLTKECLLLGEGNPSREQFNYASSRKTWTKADDIFSIIATGLFDLYPMWDQVKKAAGLHTVSILNPMMHNGPSIPYQLENIKDCREFRFPLWAGAEGPDGIVANTNKAILFGQRGFLCGLPQTNDKLNPFVEEINPKHIANIKKSIGIWKSYKNFLR